MAVNITWSLESAATVGAEPATEPHEFEKGVSDSAQNGKVFDAVTLYIRHNGAELISDAGLYLAPYSAGPVVGEFQTPAENLAEILDWGNISTDNGTEPVDDSTYGGLYLAMHGNETGAIDGTWVVNKTSQGSNSNNPILISALGINKGLSYGISGFTSPDIVEIAEATDTLDPAVEEAVLVTWVDQPATGQVEVPDASLFSVKDMILVDNGLRQVLDVNETTNIITIWPQATLADSDFFLIKDVLLVKGHSTANGTYVITSVVSDNPTSSFQVTDLTRNDPFSGLSAAEGTIELCRAGVIESAGEARIAVKLAIPSSEDQAGTRYVDHVLKFTATS